MEEGKGQVNGFRLVVRQGKSNCRRDAAASLPPRPGANVFVFAVARVHFVCCSCSGSFCLAQELAKEWVVELVSSPTSANEQSFFSESAEMCVLESWNEMARVDFVPLGSS